MAIHLVTLLLMTLLAGGFVAANLVQRNGLLAGRDVTVTGWPLWVRIEPREVAAAVHYHSNVAYDGMITGPESGGMESQMAEVLDYIRAVDEVQSEFGKRAAIDVGVALAATLLTGALFEYALRRREHRRAAESSKHAA